MQPHHVVLAAQAHRAEDPRRCHAASHLPPGQASPVTARCIAPGKCQKRQTVESFAPKIICTNSRP